MKGRFLVNVQGPAANGFVIDEVITRDEAIKEITNILDAGVITHSNSHYLIDGSINVDMLGEIRNQPQYHCGVYTAKGTFTPILN